MTKTTANGKEGLASEILGKEGLASSCKPRIAAVVMLWLRHTANGTEQLACAHLRMALEKTTDFD